MKFSIQIKYYHPLLAIGLEDIRNAWWLPADGPPVQLKTMVHQGGLTYRFPETGRRVSYRLLKKGLVRKNILIRLPLQWLPF